jgi:hypothetical protein
MKKIILIASSIAMLTSCSTQSFLKRKYTKGVFIEKTSSAELVQKNELNHSKSLHQNNFNISPSSVTFTSNSSYSNSDIKPAISNQNNLSITALNSSSKKTTTPQKINLKSSTSNHFTSTKNISQLKNTINNNTQKNSLKPSDSDKIVWVILALIPILCLIAVYLHDGKTITNNFWITLILHIFLYLECIFALLVVLDVINLK